MKLNSYCGWLLLLNSLFWLLISIAIIYFVCLVCIGFLVVFGFSYLSALVGHILISAIYILIFASVFYLKNYVQDLFNMEDGKIITHKQFAWRKEVIFWIKIYFLFLIVGIIAIFWLVLILLPFVVLNSK